MKPTDPVLQRQVEAFHEALSDFVRAYLLAERDQICCHDISLTQCYALDALLRLGPSTLNALAAELCLDKSTASRVVTTLRRKGYVGRATHPGDARAVLLDVTSADSTIGSEPIGLPSGRTSWRAFLRKSGRASRT